MRGGYASELAPSTPQHPLWSPCRRTPLNNLGLGIRLGRRWYSPLVQRRYRRGYSWYCDVQYIFSYAYAVPTPGVSAEVAFCSRSLHTRVHGCRTVVHLPGMVSMTPDTYLPTYLGNTHQAE